MKISELISKLESLKVEHGDVQVYCSDQNHYTENDAITRVEFEPEYRMGMFVEPPRILLTP